MADPNYPDDLKYHAEHDWARVEGEEAVFGITWYAQDSLGEVVFFTPPELGTKVAKGESYTEVESVKAVSDVVAPLSGEIIAANTDLGASPETINEDPYGQGWLVRVKLSDPSEADALMDADAYVATLVLSRYTSITDDDLREMLAEIGIDSIDELFADVPPELRLTGPLDIEDGLSEQQVYSDLRALARRNVSAEDEVTFLGAGMYDHYVPALIDSIISRSEFLTPYTPYQPEVSQGGLQAMFEYQTAISELTGLPISNASVYEGPSAVAAAGYLAKLHNGRRRFVVSAGVHPHAIEALSTLAHGWNMEIEQSPLINGRTVLPELDEDVSAVVIAQPNFLGAIEQLEEIVEAAHAAGALVICAADPIPLGLLKAPGDQGVDIVVGEGQTLGNRLDFGGPSFGFFAVTEALMRRLPGRIAGQTHDLDGKLGYVLTLQTREQHIRREKATSNICTAQALNALAGIIYLSWLGRRGLVELAELLVKRTAYARERLAAVAGVELSHDQPVVREFPIRVDGDLDAVIERCYGAGINPGYRLSEQELLVAITEQRTRADIDLLAETIEGALA